MHQPIAEYLRGMVAERDLCRNREMPPDYPEWQSQLAAGAVEIYRRRADAIDQQLNDLLATIADLQAQGRL